jgi:hypothetical protein
MPRRRSPIAGLVERLAARPAAREEAGELANTRRSGPAARPGVGGAHPGELAGEDPFARFVPLETPTLVEGPSIEHHRRLDSPGRLVVLMPHLDVDKMSGGPNTVFQVTARVARLGIPVVYVATSGALRPSASAVLDHIRQLTGVDARPPLVDLVAANGPAATLGVGAGDVFVATYWPTAHMANRALAHTRADEFVYLIQDFEPGFYQWSTRYVLAEETYAMPIRAIVNEPLLLDHLRASRVGRFGDGASLPAVTFTPAVDRTVFARRDRLPGRRRLVFYARPRNPRNLFELGLRAIRVAAGWGVFDRSDWEFSAIGHRLPDLPLSTRHVMHSRAWLPYEAYGALLGEADLLVSLMLSPHTSYPPLEMAAAGGLVVTNSFGVKTAAALAAISPAIRGPAPAVVAVAEAVASAVAEAEAGARPASEIALPGTWDQATADVVPWLVTQVEELRR